MLANSDMSRNNNYCIFYWSITHLTVSFKLLTISNSCSWSTCCFCSNLCCFLVWFRNIKMHCLRFFRVVWRQPRTKILLKWSIWSYLCWTITSRTSFCTSRCSGCNFLTSSKSCSSRWLITRNRCRSTPNTSRRSCLPRWLKTYSTRTFSST